MSRLDSPRSLAIARELDWQLSRWKEHLPTPLQWDENSDPPPADINAARLRAKYWGARYIIHRPFLYHALHAGRETLELEWGVEGGGGEARDGLEVNCRRCINAAIESTRAFHAFDPDTNRPVITNVFGTGHA